MPDRALREFEKLNSELNTFVSNHYNEADTRVKFIDPLLTSVLGWDEHLHIRREERYKENDDHDLTPYYVPTSIRELSTFSIVYS